MSSRGGSTANSGGTNSRDANTQTRNSARTFINKNYLLHFVALFKTTEATNKFQNTPIKPIDVVNWIATEGGSSSASKPLQDLFTLSLEKDKRALKRLQKASGGKVVDSQPEQSPSRKVLEALGTTHVLQILRAALAVHFYGKQDGRIYEIFDVVVNKLDASPRCVVGSRYIPSVIKKYDKDGQLPLATPSRFEALLFFHACSVHKSCSMPVNQHTGTRIGYVVQTVTNAWKRLFSLVVEHNLGTLTEGILPYIIFNADSGQFEVLKSRNLGWSSTHMETTLLNCIATTDEAQVSVDACSRSNEMDTAMRFITQLLFKHLGDVVRKQFLYTGTDLEIKKWKDLKKYLVSPNVDKLPSVFREIPDTISDTLSIKKEDADDVNMEEDGADQVVVDISKFDVSGGQKRKRVDSDNEEYEVPIKQEGQKVEPMLIDDVPVNVSYRPLRDREMSKKTEEKYKHVNHLMGEDFKLFTCPLNELEEQAVQLGGIDITESVDLVLTDPPYNVRREGTRHNADYDTFTPEDIAELCSLCKIAMKPGAQGIIFCSFQQFEVYRRILNEEKETFLDYDTDRTGNTTGTRSYFVVEATPLVFIKKDSSAGRHISGGCTHTNFVELAVHFWRRPEHGTSTKSLVDFNTLPSFGSNYPAYANVTNEVPEPKGEEVKWMTMEQLTAGGGVGNKSAKRAIRCKVRPEQKSVELLKYLISKFSKPGHRVMDCCAGTASTMVACMSLNQHRKFIGCEKDNDAVIAVDQDLTRCFARNLLRRESSIKTTDVNYTSAAQTVVEHDRQTKINERFDAWKIPTGLSPIQVFPEHIIEFLCEYYEDFGLLVHRNYPMIKWSDLWVQRLNNVDTKALRAYECQAYNVRIRKSTIKHKDAELGVFAKKGFKKGEVIGYYYGTLVYGDLGKHHKVRKRYGTGIMSVSSQEFTKWALQIDFTFVDADNRQHTAYICPGPMCTMRYINDARYLEGDADYDAFQKKTLKNVREANCEYVISERCKRSSHFESYKAICVKATCDIVAGQELHLNYGDNYKFPMDGKSVNESDDETGPTKIGASLPTRTIESEPAKVVTQSSKTVQNRDNLFEF